MTRLSLSSCLAVLLVSSMKVFMREQISLGAMETLSVTQDPRSILPMGSETEKMLRMLSLNHNNSRTLHFLVLRIFPEGEGVSLQDNPASVPGPEARDVIEHGDETFVRNLKRTNS